MSVTITSLRHETKLQASPNQKRKVRRTERFNADPECHVERFLYSEHFLSEHKISLIVFVYLSLAREVRR